MHTGNLRKLALETNDGVLRGPAFDAADEIDRLRAEIDRLRKALKGMDLEAQRETVEALLKPTLIHLVMKMSDDARAALAAMEASHDRT